MKIILNRFLCELFFLIIINSLFIFSINGQDLISRNLSDYPPETVQVPTGCTGATGNDCERIEIKPDARFNQVYFLTIPTLHNIDSCAVNSTTSNPSGLIYEIDTFQTCNQVRLLVTGGWNETADYDHYVDFNYHAKNNTSFPATDNQTFRIHLIRDTAKIVMVLDRSGSMDWLIPGSSIRRWDTLETAVNAFMHKLEYFRKYGDSIGITYFSSNVMQPNNSNFPKDFIHVTSNPYNPSSSANKVKNELSTVVKPYGSTAMGQGLLDAKRKLNQVHTENTKKMVLLVTDGIQNVPPYVSHNGIGLATDRIFYDGYNIAGGSNTIDSLNHYSTNTRDSIKYFIIATWEAGDEPSLLNTIAQNNGGEALNALPYTSFDGLFDVHLENMLYDNSPQIIFMKEAPELTGSVKHIFNLNAHIPTLLVHLSANLIDMTIKKNGIDLTPYAEYSPGSEFNMKTFRFPIITATDTIKSEGQWEVILTGNSSNPYYLSAIADDHYLDYTCSLNKKIYTVGDTIKLKTHLSYQGNPISGPNNMVKAFVLKPNDDIGHLLSIYETSLCDTTNDDISNPVSQKYAHLMQTDTTFFNALLPNKQEITLNNEGNGYYSGKYHHTEISGPYNILFVINGEIPGNGKFDRFKMLSSIVESDGSNSNISIFTDTSPPLTPANLHAHNITETSLNLKWLPSSDDFGIDKYLIYQNGIKISEVNYNKCHLNVNHLAPASNYSFYIQAQDASGLLSDCSNNINIVTPGEKDSIKPTAPTNLYVSDITQTYALLNWNASTDNVEVTDYEVYKNGNLAININATTTYMQNLTSNTEYNFYILAKDASGNNSEASNTITIKTLENPDTQKPTPPDNLYGFNLTQNSVYLSWNASSDNKRIAEYHVYENNILLTNAIDNQFFRSNLAPNTSYSYFIKALDAAGNISEKSNTINISTLGIPDTIAPSAPADLYASNISHSSILLKWSKSNDNVGTLLYFIYQNNELLTTVSKTTYSISNLYPGTNYSFYILAKDAAGNISNKSNIINATTLGTADTHLPAKPDNLSASFIGQSIVYLKWDPSVDNRAVAKYIIYQNEEVVDSTSSTSKLIGGLYPSTQYTYYVVAKDYANNFSEHGNKIKITTKEKADRISPPEKLTADNITQTSIHLNWNTSNSDIGGIKYGIFVNDCLIGQTSDTNYKLSGLKASEKYKIYIVASDARRNISHPSNKLITKTLDNSVLEPQDFYRTVGIKIRPKNKYGRYMGPGFKSKIKVTCTLEKTKKLTSHKASMVNDNITKTVTYPSSPYLKNIQDNLDGSYCLIIGNILPKTNPDITITVGDDILYEGSLYKIPLWFTLIVIFVFIIILLLIALKKTKNNVYKLLWLALVILLLIWYLHYTGQLLFLFGM